jgi:ParB family chromosome partitioning protein
MSPSRKLSAANLVGLEDFNGQAAPVAEPPPPAAAATALPPDGTQLVVKLPLTSIKPNPEQPRRDFDEAALRALGDSIAEGGLIQPIRVRPAKDTSDAPFELVAGERRWRAHALAGLEQIDTIIEGVDDDTSVEMALVENMARADLNPMEEAHGCARLRDRRGMSVAAIGRRVGRDRTVIAHLIRLLELPDPVQAHIADGRLSVGHGRVLLRLPDHDERKDMADRCVQGEWSVRELERQVDARTSSAPSGPHRSTDETAALAALSDRLAPVFGSNPLTIVPRRRGTYELHVRFEDLDTLTQTVGRLGEGA